MQNKSFCFLLCDTITSAPSCSRIEQRQFEANVDTEIVSTAVEHLHSKKSIFPKPGGTDVLVLCFRQEHKERFNLKRCGVVYDISKTQTFSPTACLRLYYTAFW